MQPFKKHEIHFIPVFPKQYGWLASDGNRVIFLLGKAFFPNISLNFLKKNVYLLNCGVFFLSQSISEI